MCLDTDLPDSTFVAAMSSTDSTFIATMSSTMTTTAATSSATPSESGPSDDAAADSTKRNNVGPIVGGVVGGVVGVLVLGGVAYLLIRRQRMRHIPPSQMGKVFTGTPGQTQGEKYSQAPYGHTAVEQPEAVPLVYVSDAASF